MSQKSRSQARPAGSRVAGIARTAVGTPLALAAGWLAYSHWAIDHSVPLFKAIDGERRTFQSNQSGILTCYVDAHAAGRPLVLVHSVNAAASSYEMRPLFQHYRSRRPVFALDLPGFGFSERSERPYLPHLYADAILDLIDTQIHEPVDVVALSLGAEFAARAALLRPEWFQSLALISPTGLTAHDAGRAGRGAQRAGANRTSRQWHRMFAFPVWAQGLYDLISTRTSIHYFLQQSFVGEVDRGLEDYAYATSHQPGARYAPLYFVSGRLFTREANAEIYDPLTLPVLVIYDRDPFVRFDLLTATLARHSNWQAAHVVPSNGLPQFEKLTETTAALDRFWQAG